MRLTCNTGSQLLHIPVITGPHIMILNKELALGGGVVSSPTQRLLAVGVCQLAVLQHDLLTAVHVEPRACRCDHDGTAIVDAEPDPEFILADFASDVGADEANQLFAERRVRVLDIQDALLAVVNTAREATEVVQTETEVFLEGPEEGPSEFDVGGDFRDDSLLSQNSND